MPVRAENHELTLSKTNSHAIVPVCSCGWYGGVHLPTRAITSSARLGRRIYDGAFAAAAAEHRKHLQLDVPMRATLTAENFVGTVLNTRRFGHA